jgi:uncharacterized membrane protein YqjE
MSSDAPVGAESEHASTADSVKHWVATFLRYLELRLRLLGLEAKEAGLHLLIIGLLVTGVLALFAGFLVMFAVFLLYLIITLLHWEWGWGALLCAGILLTGSMLAAVILRYRVTRPMFRMTLDELQKDREWLRSTTRNVE